MKMKHLRLCVALTLFAPGTVLIAQTTTYYGYDALGRLSVTDTRGRGTTGSAAHYNHDKASNRSKYTADITVREGLLPAGASLRPGESIVSTGGGYRFVLQHDGNLVLYGLPTQALWATMTFQPDGAHLDMQGDENLVLYSSSQAVWNSGTYGNPGASFAVQPDGNIVMYSSSGKAPWARFGL